MTDHTNAPGESRGGSSGEEDLLGPELRALLSSLPRALPPERDLTDGHRRANVGQPGQIGS